MSKTGLIIKREYLTRVRKKSFIIMSILGPILMGALLIVPVIVAEMSDGKTKQIAILDETGYLYQDFRDSESIKFTYLFTDLESAKETLFDSSYYAMLYIPKTHVALPTAAVLYSDNQINIDVKSYIRNTLEKSLEDQKLLTSGVDPEILKSIQTKIKLNTIKINPDGKEEKSSSEASTALSIFSALLIYFFIFLFGVQILRGVIEEKSNRIVEIIISSVKPFQLMMGKIIGIGLVGLTQFLIWIVFTFIIFIIFTGIYADSLPSENTGKFSTGTELLLEQSPAENATNNAEVTQVFEAIFSINFGLMILAFIIYFIGGYLLYGALFAAIGGAIDNDSDTQQFMGPVTIPLIFSIIMLQYVIQYPSSSLSVWLSMIPFTSPVVMMMRIPFGVPTYEFILSVVLLILGFLGTTWLAGKIYRTGILMYGSKVTYKTMWKWLKMKN